MACLLVAKMVTGFPTSLEGPQGDPWDSPGSQGLPWIPVPWELLGSSEFVHVNQPLEGYFTSLEVIRFLAWGRLGAHSSTLQKAGPGAQIKNYIICPQGGVDERFFFLGMHFGCNHIFEGEQCLKFRSMIDYIFKKRDSYKITFPKQL